MSEQERGEVCVISAQRVLYGGSGGLGVSFCGVEGGVCVCRYEAATKWSFKYFHVHIPPQRSTINNSELVRTSSVQVFKCVVAYIDPVWCAEMKMQTKTKHDQLESNWFRAYSRWR